jgi:hypothetical protein
MTVSADPGDSEPWQSGLFTRSQVSARLKWAGLRPTLPRRPANACQRVRRPAGSSLRYSPTPLWRVTVTACLQSMAKMSSTVYGLGRNARSVHVSPTASKRVGVSCGRHRIRCAQPTATPDHDCADEVTSGSSSGSVDDHAGG